jgi:hypothetical protein
MRGGVRKGAGRPLGSFKQDKKVMVSLRLPKYIVDWLRSQEYSQSVLVEEALLEHFRISKQSTSD